MFGINNMDYLIKRILPRMRQVFSLQRFGWRCPRALPWASMRKAFSLLHEANGYSHKANGFLPEANSLIHKANGLLPEANGLLHEANGLIHTSPGQRPGCASKKNPQPEGLPHSPANRRHHPMKQAFSLLLILHPLNPGRCPGL